MGLLRDYDHMTLEQEELSPVIMTLTPSCMPPGEPIPYLAVGADEGWAVVAEGCSSQSGDIAMRDGIYMGWEIHWMGDTLDG